jgi:hypothetical protein
MDRITLQAQSVNTFFEIFCAARDESVRERRFMELYAVCGGGRGSLLAADIASSNDMPWARYLRTKPTKYWRRRM